MGYQEKGFGYYTFMGIVGLILIALFGALLAGIFWLEGWVVSSLWNFAIAPQGLKSLTPWQGAAICLFFQTICGPPLRAFVNKKG